METFLTILISIFGTGAFWTFMQHIVDTKVKKRGEALDNIQKKLVEIDEKLDSNQNLTLASSRERLSYLTNHYLEIGYIPKDEWDVFVALGEAYIANNGNQGIDEKYLKAKQDLQVK